MLHVLEDQLNVCDELSWFNGGLYVFNSSLLDNRLAISRNSFGNLL